MGIFGWSLPPGCGTLPGEEPDDWGQDMAALLQAAKEFDTGRWDWEPIHLCLTGKDADLEPWGQQGIEFVSCDEDNVHIVVHGYKTHVGTDVSLNLPPEIENDDEKYDAALEAYLDAAQAVICGNGWPGEWDGDSWYMTFREEASVPWVYADDGVTPDYPATVQACIDKANEVIAPWEKAMAADDKYLNQLAGWRDAGELE